MNSTTDEIIRQILVMLKHRKEDLHLTYDEIVKKSGLSKTCVALTMSPKGIKTLKGVRLSTLIKLCQALEVKMWFGPQ